MCDEEICKRQMLQRNEYNITKARRCDIECCPEDRCNHGKLTVLNVAEMTGDMSKGEAPFISCVCVIALALASFILGNN